MRKSLDKLDALLLVLSALLYIIVAKMHFFTRYWARGLGGYLEGHWFLWRMAIIGAIAICLHLIRKRLERTNSN